MQHLGFSYHFLALNSLQDFKKDFFRLLNLQMEQPKNMWGIQISTDKKTIREIYPESLNIENLHAEWGKKLILNLCESMRENPSLLWFPSTLYFRAQLFSAETAFSCVQLCRQADQLNHSGAKIFLKLA